MNPKCELSDCLISDAEHEPGCPKGAMRLGGGLRYDEGKERVDLLPPDALMELGKVYGAGAKKYAERNWEQGMKWSKMLGPLLRHLFRRLAGEKVDHEDGQLHMAKVAWNAMGLLTYELREIGTDDITIKKTAATEGKAGPC